MKRVIGFTLAVFLFSLVGTVALHYQLQPPSPVTAEPRVLEERSPQSLNKPELKQQQKALVADIDRLETEVDRTDAQHRLAKARAQSLINELERYQNERDAFLAAYEERKSDIENRLAELDRAIEEQLAEQEERNAQLSELDARYQLDSMLAYPHPLNDADLLREAMLTNPRQNLERAQHHYEIILQAPDYSRQEQLYNQLEPLLADLNKRYHHQPEILVLQCGSRFCEIQLQMERPEPYVDYWRATLDAIQANTGFGPIEDNLVVEENDRITGMIVSRRLGSPGQ